MSTSGVSWSWGPADSRVVRVLLYAVYGVLGGVSALALVGASYLFARTVLSGESDSTFLLWVLVVGWLLAMTAIVVRTSHSTLRETRPFAEFYRVSRLRWYVTATVLGAGMHVLLFAYSPLAWVLGFLLGVFASLAGAKLLSSEGELDRDARTLTYQGTDVDLESVVGVHRFTVGERTFLWLSFARGQGDATTPRLLVVPPRLADAVQDVVETGPEPESAETGGATRAALLGAALGFLGVAVGVGTLLARNEGLGVAVGSSAIFAVFGLLFLWLAVIEP